MKGKTEGMCVEGGPEGGTGGVGSCECDVIEREGMHRT